MILSLNPDYRDSPLPPEMRMGERMKDEYINHRGVKYEEKIFVCDQYWINHDFYTGRVW